MIQPIDFTNQHQFEVEISDDELGTVGPATLSFGPERWCHIEFSIFATFAKMPMGKLSRPLKARTSDGTQFTLFHCTSYGQTIDIGYVVAGDTDGRLKRIEVRYSDISEWYLGWQQLQGVVGETVSWTNRAKQIATTIRVKSERFALATEFRSSIKQSGEDHILHQHVAYCFEHLTGTFTIEDMRDKVTSLANLVSILIAYPLSIVSVQVTSEKGNTYQIFFPTFEPVERDPSDNNFFWRCLIRHDAIHDRWGPILNRYFNSPYRKISWTRLAGMLRYRGFWEYRALGYVSLLDQYVDQRHRGIGGKKKIRVPVGAKAIAKLTEALKSLSPPLPPAKHAEVMRVVGEIFAHDRELEFAEKYRRVATASNQDVLKIIDISDDDFDLIKTVRNRIAHGKSLDFPDTRLERIGTVVSKIVLLLTYWAFLDFGLTDDDFLACLGGTRNFLRFEAQPDLTHLDRITRPESFFSVGKSEFERISGIKGVRANSCFSQNKFGAIRYSEEYSEKYRNWLVSRATGPGITPHSEIFGVAQERIRYLAPMYIESGDRLLQVAAAWVIQDV